LITRFAVRSQAVTETRFGLTVATYLVALPLISEAIKLASVFWNFTPQLTLSAKASKIWFRTCKVPHKSLKPLSMCPSAFSWFQS
jgi:hypothetical protein